MNDDRAKTCKHSTGQIGQLAVYVLPRDAVNADSTRRKNEPI